VARFDRYMLSQLMVSFGLFALVLVLVYWINRAVRLFDQIIASGESANVFLELSMLTLPGVIKLVTPVAAFAATVYVTNRISNESELVIVQQAGFSPWRIARPVLVFGLLVAVFAGLLAHVLVPASLSRLADRQDDLAENVTARLLVEGRFLHPSDGVTFYIARISPEGELDDVFLSDGRQPGRWTTYTADRGLLVRNGASPRLIMFDGMLQRLDEETGRMSVTRYDQLTLDIASILGAPARSRTDVTEVFTGALLAATPETLDLTRATRGDALYEAHGRITHTLLAVTAPLLGFATLLLGGFSRFGIWRRVVGAVALLVLIQSAGLATSAIPIGRPDLWPIYYLPTVLALGAAGGLLTLAARPALLRRRAGRVPA
jgi:lipopolysaccharide export system permease protein